MQSREGDVMVPITIVEIARSRYINLKLPKVPRYYQEASDFDC